MTKINEVLARLFLKHRIVFWYDDKQELQADFDEVALPGVEKISLANNQLGVKYRILREEKKQKFLLYHAGPAPADLDNWLLDVQLAHGVFSADQCALWLSELGLGFVEFGDLCREHTEFFKTMKRREAINDLLREDDTKGLVRLKMLAVCTSAEPRLDDILESLLDELASQRDKKMRLILLCELEGFLWQQMERTYGYVSETPGIRDFSIKLFNSSYAISIGDLSTGESYLSNDALVFLKRWKDSVRHHESFEILSAECAGILNIQQDLEERDYRTLADLDYFESIDRRILSGLARDVANRTISSKDAEELIRQRRRSHWYEIYRHPYEAIFYASRLFLMLEKVDLRVQSFVHGIEQYSRIWYELDQLYRKVIYHARQSGLSTLLAELLEQVENRYTNSFLLKVNTEWQPMVDAAQRWEAPSILLQKDFFEVRVDRFLRKGNKIIVVISDALRYEIGEELLRRIRQEDRYEAQLEPALTSLPSFTQLGMAALLPHETLSFSEKADAVLVDGESSQGTPNRQKILNKSLPGRGMVVKAEDFMSLNKDESRAMVRDHDVIYLYHNQIDATGDKRDSEERVFDAVEDTLEMLVMLIKKLTGANASNILVTADHGFIYQNKALDESDFAAGEAKGKEILVTNRRFVLGRGLKADASFKHFSAEAVGLQGDMEMLFPKTINRLRVKGAGSRYVHGGTSLQEIVIPVIEINKKRQSDITQVEVDILRGTTSVITTGQLTVALYQTEAVTDKVQARELRVGIYTQVGELISDQHSLSFDLTSDNPRDREQKVQFILTSKADEANEQEVILRLDEKVPDTNYYREYKTARYLLRRSFTSDFDF